MERTQRTIGERFANVGKFIAFLAIAFLLTIPINMLFAALHVSEEWQSILAPLPVFVYGLNGVAHAALATVPMALWERRSWLAYGFRLSRTSVARYIEGSAVGIALAAGAALLMLLFHGMQIQGFQLHGWQWIAYPLSWTAALVVATLAEEALLRGYALVALSRGIGFWPAALVTSLLFAWGHATKPGETMADLSSIFLFGMLACFLFRQTGSLWLACGFHFGFDFMQLAVTGTPNGTQQPVGAVLQATFNGPAWVNGGPLGTEASYFMFPLLIVVAAYFAWRFPRAHCIDPLGTPGGRKPPTT